MVPAVSLSVFRFEVLLSNELLDNVAVLVASSLVFHLENDFLEVSSSVFRPGSVGVPVAS